MKTEKDLVCGQCDGSGYLDDPYDYYDVDIPDRCLRCGGTGRWVRGPDSKEDSEERERMERANEDSE